MSDILFVFFVGSTKIGEISDISKCFENFVSQTLGVLTRIYAAELRLNINLKTIIMDKKKIKETAMKYGKIAASAVAVAALKALTDKKNTD